ncbi:hypothetical protein CHUAL_009936 [Chamberlinius hualienensis]
MPQIRWTLRNQVLEMMKLQRKVMTRGQNNQHSEKKNYPTTFRNAINSLVYYNFFYGCDIRQDQKHHIVCNSLYAVHYFIGLYCAFYSIVKCEFGSGDTQKLVFSIMQVALTANYVIIKTFYRLSCSNFVTVINEIEIILCHFEKEKRCFLVKIRRLSKFLLIFPMIAITVHYVRISDYYLRSTSQVLYGNAIFDYLNQNYNIEFIYMVLLSPFNHGSIAMITLMTVTILQTLQFILFQLNQLSPKQIVKFIKCHRRVCKVYRLTSDALSSAYTTTIVALLSYTLNLARNIVNNSHNFSIGIAVSIIGLLAILTVHIVILANANYELKKSLSNLLNLEYRMKIKSNKSHLSHNNMLPKLELYVDQITFQSPYIKFLSITYKPIFIVGMIEFMLCYILVLYRK